MWAPKFEFQIEEITYAEVFTNGVVGRYLGPRGKKEQETTENYKRGPSYLALLTKNY